MDKPKTVKIVPAHTPGYVVKAINGIYDIDGTFHLPLDYTPMEKDWTFNPPDEELPNNNITSSQKDRLNKLLKAYTDMAEITEKCSDYKTVNAALDLMEAMSKTIKELTQMCDALYQDRDIRSNGGHPLYPKY